MAPVEQPATSMMLLSPQLGAARAQHDPAAGRAACFRHRTNGPRRTPTFVTVQDFVEAFDFTARVWEVEIDLTHAHIWDGSVVAAIDKVVLKLRATGANVRLAGVDEASASLLDLRQACGLQRRYWSLIARPD